MPTSYPIAVIPGDGIGPEVIREGQKVLEAAARKYNFHLDWTEFDYGGERFLKTGEVLSDAEVSELRAFKAIYLGGIGHPDVKPGILEKGILLKLRFDLDQYINLRPVKLYENVATPLRDKRPEDMNYVVVRENTGGLYTGVGEFRNRGTSEEVAVQQMIYSRMQVERCIRYAFDLVQSRHKDSAWHGLTAEERGNGFIGKLTLCGKTNVLTYVFDLWERIFHEVGKNYPHILQDYCHVDAICIYMIETPQRFDGIVTSNMFGDIITDLAATTQGGMGVAASGNINPHGVSMFEPVHGTAPAFTGKNVINPVATILTGVMMLEYLGETTAARAVEEATKKVLKKMISMLVGQMGFSTEEVGEMIKEEVENG